MYPAIQVRPAALGGLLASRPEVIQAALVGSILLLAVAVRWPYLEQIPELTDETIEINRALGISRGEHYPLTSYVAWCRAHESETLADNPYR